MAITIMRVVDESKSFSGIFEKILCEVLTSSETVKQKIEGIIKDSSKKTFFYRARYFFIALGIATVGFIGYVIREGVDYLFKHMNFH